MPPVGAFSCPPPSWRSWHSTSRASVPTGCSHPPEKGTPRGPPPQGKAPKPPGRTAFQPVKGKYRKPGTGCISQLNDHLWEGRYSPKVNGKRMSQNVYAKTEAECEMKLAELIREMKAEIAAGKERKKRTALAG